jgi:dTDP-4-dehydrorhamnose reductase
MRLLVFGQTGQVARELVRRAPSDVSLVTLGRTDADLSRPETCAAAIRSATADAVINAAAWTAVDKAETEEAEAMIVNGAAPMAMAIACAAKRIPILHISTDYVFDGAGDTPFTPDHPTAPLGAYGRSKLVGERGVRGSKARHVILRTSWVVSAHGTNFIKTMLRLGSERQELNVVADQVGGPTPAAAIADALFTCARSLVSGAPGGTYHFAGEPDVSWADFARAIMASAGLPCAVGDIPSCDYPTPARRPQNSRLDCASLTRDFGIARPDWRVGLADILSDLKAA